MADSVAPTRPRRPELSLDVKNSSPQLSGTEFCCNCIAASSSSANQEASPSPAQICLHNCSGVRESAGSIFGRGCGDVPPSRLVYATVQCVGPRPTMEDFIDHSVKPDAAREEAERDASALFVAALYDGHGGAEPARHVAKSRSLLLGFLAAKSPEEAAKLAPRAFIEADEALLGATNSATLSIGEYAGTTATVIGIYPQRGFAHPVACANVGDSSAIIFSRWGKPRALTVEHSAELEKDRVEAAGGIVFSQRVAGSLAVARALGDFYFKRSHSSASVDHADGPVSASPHACVNRLLEGELLIVATDGLWNGVAKPEDAANQIFAELDAASESRADLSVALRMDKALERLARKASAVSRDNVAACIVYFEPRV